MAGIIQNAQAPNLNPAQQQALERVEVAATKIIHDAKVSQQLVQMMKAAGDPVTGIAQATLLIMRQLIEKSKNTIPQEVLVPAGFKVVEQLAELGAAAKLFQNSPDLVKQAQRKAIQMFLKSVDPKLLADVRAKMEGGAQPAAPAPAAAAPAPGAPAPAAQPAPGA